MSDSRRFEGPGDRKYPIGARSHALGVAWEAQERGKAAVRKSGFAPPEGENFYTCPVTP